MNERQLPRNEGIDERLIALQNSLADFDSKLKEQGDMVEVVKERMEMIKPNFVVTFIKQRDKIQRLKVLAQNNLESLIKDFDEMRFAMSSLVNIEMVDKKLKQAEKFYKNQEIKHENLQETCDDIHRYYSDLKKSNYITSAYFNGSEFQYLGSDLERISEIKVSTFRDFGRQKSDSVIIDSNETTLPKQVFSQDNRIKDFARQKSDSVVIDSDQALLTKAFSQDDVIKDRQQKLNKIEQDAIVINDTGKIIAGEIDQQGDKLDNANKMQVIVSDNLDDANENLNSVQITEVNKVDTENPVASESQVKSEKKVETKHIFGIGKKKFFCALASIASALVIIIITLIQIFTLN